MSAELAQPEGSRSRYDVDVNSANHGRSEERNLERSKGMASVMSCCMHWELH